MARVFQTFEFAGPSASNEALAVLAAPGSRLFDGEYELVLAIARGEIVYDALVSITKITVMNSSRVLRNNYGAPSEKPAVTASHNRLVAQGWNLDAEGGRHDLGSQLYGYWLGPFGNRIEHSTNTDMITDEYEPVRLVWTAGETTQWGMAPPSAFFE